MGVPEEIQEAAGVAILFVALGGLAFWGFGFEYHMKAQAVAAVVGIASDIWAQSSRR